jgi:hypothetical protein
VHRNIPAKLLIALLMVLLVPLAAGAQELPGDGADEAAAGEQGYTGTWSLVIGPSRLVWELQADSYLFYAYQAGAVRIGSRGDLTAEDGQLVFRAREITEDGETWREVELPEEEATATFAYSVRTVQVRVEEQPPEGPAEEQAEEPAGAEEGAPEETEEQQVLRLALPGRPQFHTDYQAGAGEPVEPEGSDGEAAAGAGEVPAGAEGE